jgi:hypothetical protein
MCLGQPGAFSLADPDRVRNVLSDAEFMDVTVEEVVAPMRLGDSVDDTVAFMQRTDSAQQLIADVPDDVARASGRR